MIKKLFAELIGTFTLVFVGCGTAMLVGCSSAMGSGYILTALAFGLSIVAMAYSIGNISGCHVNPAVSLAVLIRGDIKACEFVGYVIAQVIGSVIASFTLAGLFFKGRITDMTGAFGSNGLAGVNGNILAGLIAEAILTFIFVLAILGVTDKDAGHGSFGGLVIGLTLTLVHIIGIGLTGTSVNPARSFGPALAALVSGNAEPISQMWIFAVGPFVGAAAAACIYTLLKGKRQ